MKKLYRRSISGLMALLICFTTILGGGITAFAASSSGEVAKSYSIGFPRSGDANLDYSGTWGHDELHYMNGWTSGEATWMTTLHTIGSFDGPACYCIEPGVPRLLEKTYTRYGEDYWKNYPSDCNSTIDADTIKTLLGRIMQYGYQGDLSLDWRSQNEADKKELASRLQDNICYLLEQGVATFLFGDHSEFNSLCYEVVSELREVYPQIRRIHYRTDYPDADA